MDPVSWKIKNEVLARAGKGGERNRENPAPPIAELGGGVVVVLHVQIWGIDRHVRGLALSKPEISLLVYHSSRFHRIFFLSLKAAIDGLRRGGTVKIHCHSSLDVTQSARCPGR